MWKQENQPPRPTAGCLSVPLFNQKKRSRIPLTSAPSENEFFSHSELMTSTSSAAAGGCHQASGPSSGPLQTQQWNKQSLPLTSPPQQYVSNRPAPGPAAAPAPAPRAYGLIPHPYKAGNKSSGMGQPGNPVRQQGVGSSFSSRQNRYPPSGMSETAQSRPAPRAGFSQICRQPSPRPPISTQRYSQQPRFPPPPPPPPAPAPPAPAPPPRRPPAPAVQPQKNSWKFTSSFEPQTASFEAKRSSNPPQTVQPTQQGPPPAKPAVESSLRILTAVIDGMRHWSKFKDRAPYLFEIFATLDSAVTLGRYGAKCFLIRNGKEAVQCVFYENEQALPRLIRGQVHRCVGNYDGSKDVLVCVSVRAALPSELRNAQEAVRACDAEMRALVKSLSEV